MKNKTNKFNYSLSKTKGWLDSFGKGGTLNNIGAPKYKSMQEAESDPNLNKSTYSGTPYNTNRDNSEVFQEGKNKGKVTGRGALETSLFDPIDLVAGGIGTFLAKPSNAYKLNPFRFKANSKNGYRVLGDEGFIDAEATQVLRAKPIPGGRPQEGISLRRNINRNPNTNKMQPALDRPYFADGIIDERYGRNYLAEVNKLDNDLVPIPTHKGIAPREAKNIPIENATFYKKHWLKGYKEIPKPINKVKPTIKTVKNTNTLPENMHPYISKKITPASREEEVYNSFLSPQGVAKNIEKKTTIFDNKGNIIKKNGGWLDKLN